MKTFYSLFLSSALLLSLLVTSCADQLNINPKGVLADDLLLGKPEHIDDFVSGYRYISFEPRSVIVPYIGSYRRENFHIVPGRLVTYTRSAFVSIIRSDRTMHPPCMSFRPRQIRNQRIARSHKIINMFGLSLLVTSCADQ